MGIPLLAILAVGGAQAGLFAARHAQTGRERAQLAAKRSSAQERLDALQNVGSGPPLEATGGVDAVSQAVALPQAQADAFKARMDAATTSAEMEKILNNANAASAAAVARSQWERNFAQQKASNARQAEAHEATKLKNTREAAEYDLATSPLGIARAKTGVGERVVMQGNTVAGFASIPGSKLEGERITAQTTPLERVENVQRMLQIVEQLSTDELLDANNVLAQEYRTRSQIAGGQIRDSLLKSGVPSGPELELQARALPDITDVGAQLTRGKSAFISALSAMEELFAAELKSTSFTHRLETFNPQIWGRTQGALSRVGQAMANSPHIAQEQEFRKAGLRTVSDIQTQPTLADVISAQELEQLRAGSRIGDQEFPIGTGFGVPPETSEALRERTELVQKFIQSRGRIPTTTVPALDAAIEKLMNPFIN